MCHDGDEVVALFGLGHKSGNEVGVAVRDIGVGEEDVVGAGWDGGEALLQRPELAFPFRGARWHTDYGIRSGPLCDGSGGVGALIVGHRYAELEWAFLLAERCDSLGDDFGFVTRGNHHRDCDFRGVLQVRAGQPFAQTPEHAAKEKEVKPDGKRQPGNGSGQKQFQGSGIARRDCLREVLT